MASTAPPVLPISNPQTVPSAAPSSVESQPPIATTPAFRNFVNQITDTVKNGLSKRRPWAELADRSALSKPESISDAAVRIRKNYSYFKVNYLTVATAIVGFSLVTHPFSLVFLLCLLASWLFLYMFRPTDQPLVVFGRTFSDRETLGCLILFSIFVVFLTDVGSVLVSAMMVGVALICAHGAFRAPEDLFLDEQEPAATGFLSFLGGAASNAAPAIVAARV
ncbi:PREDICTED: PRA1 family protein B4 [Camelina sativa]|uniref:PRA1 family protein n=1 Tax=Camelina sativa TaxID=90675 RepID=A0ABM0YT26_CAMSA|nr:PREDICTED: PRA1 family protein B4 [Camelina sativa]XP_010517129.1 PREDICTED: PRA1 family protein B4 [Camelina sativa]